MPTIRIATSNAGPGQREFPTVDAARVVALEIAALRTTYRKRDRIEIVHFWIVGNAAHWSPIERVR